MPCLPHVHHPLLKNFPLNLPPFSLPYQAENKDSIFDYWHFPICYVSSWVVRAEISSITWRKVGNFLPEWSRLTPSHYSLEALHGYIFELTRHKISPICQLPSEELYLCDKPFRFLTFHHPPRDHWFSDSGLVWHLKLILQNCPISHYIHRVLIQHWHWICHWIWRIKGKT